MCLEKRLQGFLEIEYRCLLLMYAYKWQPKLMGDYGKNQYKSLGMFGHVVGMDLPLNKVLKMQREISKLCSIA